MTFDIFDRLSENQTIDALPSGDIFDQLASEEVPNTEKQDIFDRISEPDQIQDVPEPDDAFDKVVNEETKKTQLSPFKQVLKDTKKAGEQLTENFYEEIKLNPKLATPEFAQFLEEQAEVESRFAKNAARVALDEGRISQEQFDSFERIQDVQESVEFASNFAISRDLRKKILNEKLEKGQITKDLKQTLDILVDEEPNLLMDELKGIASGLTFTVSELITGPSETAMGTMGTLAGSFFNLGSISSRIAKPLINLTKEAGPVARTTLPAFFRIAGWGVEGATRKGVENLVREKELPTAKELLEEGASWAAVAGILEGANLAVEFGAAVNKISKDFGVSRKDVLKRVLKGLRDKGKDILSPTPVIEPDEILGALEEVKNAERLLELEQKPIDIVPKTNFQEIAEGKTTLSDQAQRLEDQLGRFKERIKGLPELGISESKNTFDINLDTRGKGNIFHGSPSEISGLAEGVFSSLNYYGQGFYTTDALDVAEGYSLRRDAESPTIYRVTEKHPVKLLDMEAKVKNLPREVQDIYREFFEFGENTRFRELYDDLRESGDPADEIQEDYLGIQEKLEALGFDGLKHEGGRLTGKKVHEVKIYFSPERDLDIEKVTLSKDLPKATEATQKFIREKTQQELADIQVQQKITEEPEGLSKEAEEQVISENREFLSEQDQAVLKDAEVEGFYINALLKDKFSKTMENWWNRQGFNVERPFQQSGAPETGFAVKNYFTELAKKEEQTLSAIKRLKNLSPEQRSDLALAAEKAKPPTDPQGAKDWKVVRDFFDETFQDLKKANVLKFPFPQSYIQRLESENKLLLQRQKEKTLSSAAAQKQIKENLQTIRDLEDIRFVSIPARLWFADKFDTNPGLATRGVRILNQKKRKTPTIAGMIEDGIIDKDQVDISEIMAFYGRRAAKDIGLSKIIEAAKKEGLSSNAKVPGFIQLPPWQYPAIKGRWIHPKFAEWLTTYVNPRQMGIFSKVSSMVKGFMFYNPMILPFNDIVQQAMLTGIQGPKYWKLAAKDILKETPEFWQAYENGLFSQPYNMFFDDYQRQWKSSLKENRTLPKRIKRLLLDDKFGIQAAYRVSNNLAWSMDRIIRMASYRSLLERGMSPREAAQTAALFHGDYAMVSPATRRKLNSVFFTPTFKIVMGKAYSEMLKSSGKVGKAILTRQKISKEDKAKAFPLIGTLAIAAAFDQIFTTGFGFERDEYGRKYSKRKENDEGVEKDLTVTLSNPATLPFKFFWRTIESFAPSSKTALSQLLRKNRFELNPLLNLATQFVENKKPNGDPIYEDFGDDSLTKAQKSLEYIAQQLFPLLRKLGSEEFEDPKAREKFKSEVGALISAIPGQFVYFGATAEEKKLRQMKDITNTFYKRAYQKARKGEEFSEKELEQYRKALNSLSE